MVNFQQLFELFKQKLLDIRSFIDTKIGSRLALLFIADSLVLFFAPLMHGFVGTAIFACVASVFLILCWRRFDKEHIIVPTVLICIPMLLDMLIYIAHPDYLAILSGLVMAIIAIFLVGLSPLFNFYERIGDPLYAYLGAGAICAGVVIAACILMIIVGITWWIICIIAFLIVLGVFLGVVFSTAAYTASDGRRQAKRNAEKKAQEAERRYNEYRPQKRDTRIYNLDDDDFIDVE